MNCFKISTIAFLFFSLTANGQVWFQENDEWIYRYGNWAISGYDHLKVNGDTTINGRECHLIKPTLTYVDLSVSNDTITSFGFPWIVYEENDQVFYWSEDNFYLIYDFNLNVNDTLQLRHRGDPGTFDDDHEICDPFYFVIDSLDVININGFDRRVQYGRVVSGNWGFEQSSHKIIEGIGWVALYSSFHEAYVPARFLITDYNFTCTLDLDGWSFCSYQNDDFSYKTDETQNCEYLPMLINTDDVNNNINVVVYPNPTNSLINIKYDQKINNITILDINGLPIKNYLGEQRALNVSEFTDGMYFIRIETPLGFYNQKLMIY